MTQEAETPKPRKKGRKRRAGLIALLAVGLVVAAVALGTVVVMGRALTAPDWVRAEIEARLARQLPGTSITFGDLSLVLQRNGVARVNLKDVDVATAQGDRLAALSDLEFGLDPWQLIRGQTHLKEARLSGAFVTLRRDRDGRIGVALGDPMGDAGQTPDIPTLLGQLDTALTDPRLSGLKYVEADALTLRYEDARARRGWTVDGGRLRIDHDFGDLSVSGDFAVLAGGADVATLSVNMASGAGFGDVAFGVSFQNMPSTDIATQSPALAWLESLRAPISGSMRGQMLADGSLGPLNATLQIGEGVLQPNNETRPVPFTSARTYFTYIPTTQTLNFNEIAVDTEWGAATADGKAVMEGIEGGYPTAMLGQFHLRNITANPKDVFETPVVLDGAQMDFKLELDPFTLHLGQLRLDDVTVPVSLSGELIAESEGWRLAVDGRATELKPERVLELWPFGVVPKTRKWLSENVSSGVLRDVQLSLRSAPDQAKPDVYLDLTASDATVRYAKTLPVLKNAAGQVTLHDGRLVVMLDQGVVTPSSGGTLDGAGSSFVIPNTRQKPAQGLVELRAKGPVKAVLALIDTAPLSILSKAGRTPDLASGDIDVAGTLKLPLKKGIKAEDVLFALTGTGRNVRSTSLVKGRPLTSDALKVEVDNSQIEISGIGALDGIPIRGGWKLALGKGQGTPSFVDGQIQISENFAKKFNIALPQGSISGATWADAKLKLQKGKPATFEMSSNLTGLGLKIAAIGWSLGQKTKGTLRVAGALGTPPRIDRISLDAPGLKTSGKVALNSNGTLDRITLDRVRAGGWLDAPVVLKGRGKNVPPAITLTGGSMDMRAAPFGKTSGGSSQGGGQIGPTKISLDRLTISDGIALSPFDGTFKAGKGLDGSFVARVNGDAKINGTVSPQNGQSAFRITAEDAGDVLSSAGLFKNAQNGDFKLKLTPTGKAGNYDGALDVNGVRLRNAPAMAALLDAISVVGLLDQLGGPGIFFNEVEARFRLTPDQVILRRSSAVGPSMGISLDGYYNLKSKQMDMQGVVSPIYILNSIGRIFSKKGEGLIGFNFNLKGPTSNPKVLVNPLSALTPGMFREIFRRPPPKISN